MKINPRKQCEIGLLLIACLVLFAFAFSARAEAQWKVIDVTDDFTGEFKARVAASPPAAAKGGPWFTTKGGLVVQCDGNGELTHAFLWFDSFSFHDHGLAPQEFSSAEGRGSPMLLADDHGRFAPQGFSTNADGKIEDWEISEVSDDQMLVFDARERFVDMLAYASSLKVRARSRRDGYATLDINMEGAEQAIRKACPNYSPRNRKQADQP